ncbi:hypothetical protein AJ79_07813 [Helicocarpus griseus UAMH5409]|uniref:Uncharacterized protein n=1 Tax=Helicocarpus griseus UAMH5409 TaxID=1447875 RepID=A0A2B7WYK7_9EURO|nr:hypothetical protein AJ79_07813 [Helicocarpus griseus UAMH5409]
MTSPPPTYESLDRPPDYFGRHPFAFPPSPAQGNTRVRQSTQADKIRMQRTPPSQYECIVHLKLLAAIADLRDEVSTIDGLFGLQDSLFDDFSSEDNKAKAAALIREKRWQIYVSRAVYRFETWLDKCIPIDGGIGSSGQVVTVDHIDDGQDYKKVTDWDSVIPFTVDDLPPLDVIMVWHSYMLNPRIFLEDCIRLGNMSLWVTGMPWEVIDVALDAESFNFIPGDMAKESFQQLTGLPWDNLHNSPTKLLTCPRCSATVHVEWQSKEWEFNSLTHPFDKSDGYADKGFHKICSNCSLEITHATLQVHQFRRDMARLQFERRPMPGTLLSPSGLPEPTKERAKEGMQLPNKMIRGGLYQKLLDETDFYKNPTVTIETIRTFFEYSFKYDSDRGPLTSRVRAPRTPEQRLAFRRLLSRYWGNSSPFGLDLVGAVIRQGTFITKMDTIDWIHSPTLETTISHLLKRYTVFIRIIAMNNKLAVPTLDIDLAWHTHQLSPQSYFRYSVHMTRDRFVDHDDKIAEDNLSNAFKWTSKKYMEMTDGKPYSECLCWYCEAVREGNHDQLMSGYSTSRARELTDQLRHDARVNDDPTGANPHISSHNAAQIPDGNSHTNRKLSVRWRMMEYHEKAQRRLEKRRKAAEKEERKREKKNKNKNKSASSNRDSTSTPTDSPRHSIITTPPSALTVPATVGIAPASKSRNRYGYYPVVWGYPVFVPFYAPYAVDPAITPALYPANPACMSAEAEGAGNCIAGTCIAEVAAGGCGGDGGAGTGAGGCGGGSWGGGCGGGGGGSG